MKVFELPPTFNKTTLSNGVRVLTEHHPNTRATSAGIFVPLGTRDEDNDMVGAAHFIEHMVFKGTKNRSAFEIAKSLEAVGGDLNAYTAREYTCFHGMSLKEHLPLSLDVLADLVAFAEFNAEDFEKERQVILAEIDMSADQLEEYIFDLYFEAAYKNHNLGRPILGTPASLEKITRRKLLDYYKSRYRGSNLIVSIAGSVDHDEAVELVKNVLGKGRVASKAIPRKKPKVLPFKHHEYRNSEQVHILMGQPASDYKDEYRFEAYIVNAVLGGGMTSRLYQKVREKRGLVYAIYSYLHAFTDCGLMMVYAGTSPQNVKKVMDLIYKEVANLLDKGVTKRELDFFKRQVKGSILLGADDIENRMNSLGINEMVFEKYRPVEQVIEEIDRVSIESLRTYMEKYMDMKKFGIYLIGNIEKDRADEYMAKY